MLLGQARDLLQYPADVLVAVGIRAGQKCQERIDDQEAGTVLADQPADKRRVVGNLHRAAAVAGVDLA